MFRFFFFSFFLNYFFLPPPSPCTDEVLAPLTFPELGLGLRWGPPRPSGASEPARCRHPPRAAQCPEWGSGGAGGGGEVPRPSPERGEPLPAPQLGEGGDAQASPALPPLAPDSGAMGPLGWRGSIPLLQHPRTPSAPTPGSAINIYTVLYKIPVLLRPAGRARCPPRRSLGGLPAG